MGQKKKKIEATLERDGSWGGGRKISKRGFKKGRASIKGQNMDQVTKEGGQNKDDRVFILQSGMRIQGECFGTNCELMLHSRCIAWEIMGTLGLTGVAKPCAEHLLLLSMETTVSL